MASGVLRSQILSDVRQHADQVGTLVVTDAELNRWIDQEAKALHDLIIDAAGALYQLSTASVALTAGLAGYSLASYPTFYMLKSVYALVGTTRRNLTPHQGPDAEFLNTTPDGYGPSRYQLFGSQENGVNNSTPRINFFPTPTAAGTIYIDFIPSYLPVPTALDPSFDGINGWEDYVVWNVVAQIKDKLEEDPTFALGKVAQVQDRIKRLRAKRDAANPGRVRDVNCDAPWMSPRLPWVVP